MDGLRRLFDQLEDGEAVAERGVTVLQDASLQRIEETVMRLLSESSARPAEASKPMLIWDGLDLLLAATNISAHEIIDMVAEVQEVSSESVGGYLAGLVDVC